MSPWTALLESLHSSVIDELNERLPKSKPVLGMPVRYSEWRMPQSSVKAFVVMGVELGASRGLVAIGISPGLGAMLKLNAVAFWNALVKRAGSEFGRRGIQPRFSQHDEVQGGQLLPKSIHPPSRLIWMPLGVDGEDCVFGIGA